MSISYDTMKEPVQKHNWKRRKCRQPVLTPFPTMFSIFLRENCEAHLYRQNWDTAKVNRGR